MVIVRWDNGFEAQHSRSLFRLDSIKQAINTDVFVLPLLQVTMGYPRWTPLRFSVEAERLESRQLVPMHNNVRVGYRWLVYFSAFIFLAA